MYKLTVDVGVNKMVRFEKISVGIASAVVLLSTSIVLPEYFHVSNPGVGTCLHDNGGLGSPVACWSTSADYKIVGYAATSVECGTDWYFDPSTDESRFTCVIKL